MKLLPFLIFLLLSNCGFSQLDIEKFKAEIEDFTVVETTTERDTWVIKTYASPDSLLVYEVAYNKQGEMVNGSWGVAIDKRLLDEKGRVIEYTYYGVDGEFATLDTPPIIRKEYYDYLLFERTSYLYADSTLAGAIESEFDDKGRVIEERSLNEYSQLVHRTTFEFDDEKQSCTIKNFNVESELESSKCGCAIRVIFYENGVFDQYDHSNWREERYYDKQMKLVDCVHKYFIEEDFSIIERENLDDNRMRLTFRNRKNKIVKIEEFTQD